MSDSLLKESQRCLLRQSPHPRLIEVSDSLLKESLAKSTLSGLSWQYASAFAQAFLRLGVLAILARLLSPEEFGLIGSAMIFVNLSALVSQLGVGPAIVQRHNLTALHMRVGFTLSILMGALITLILCALAPLIALLFHNSDLKAVIYGVSPSFFLASFGVVAESLLWRTLRFRELTWLDFGSYALGYAPVGITLAFLRYGVWALVGATLAQKLLRSIFVFALQRHVVIPSLRLKELRELLHFGGGFTLAQILNFAATQADNFIVGVVLGMGPLGIYTRAYQLMMLPATYFAAVLQKVMFPVMAKTQDGLNRMTRIFLVSISGISLVSAPLSAVMFICAPEIVSVLFGPKWTAVVAPFRVLSLGVLFRTAYKMGDSVADATGAVYQHSIRELVYVVAVTLGTWAGANWGLTGVATGVLLAITMNYILAITMSKGIVGFSWRELLHSQASGALPTMLAILVAGPTRYLLRSANLPALLLLLSTSFVTMILLVGVLLLRPTIVGNYGMTVLSTVVRFFPGPFSWVVSKLNK